MARTLPRSGRFDHPIPAAAGVGLKPEHYRDVHEGAGRDLWFEVHPENYMGAGGPPHRHLEAIRRDHALSMHSVGLSLGSADGLCELHLFRLKALVDRYQPALVSDHLSWSGVGQHVVPDLLPVPLSRESLQRFARNIDRVQDVLARPILIENPSIYLAPAPQEIPEPDFIAALCRRTGCGWLLEGAARLADLARLEYAWLEAYHAPEAHPLPPAALAALTEEQLVRARLRFHPSVRLLRSDHAIDCIWERYRDPSAHETAPQPHGPACLAVLRPAAEVIIMRISTPTFAALVRLRDGAMFGDATDDLNEAGHLTELQALIAAGLFTKLEAQT